MSARSRVEQIANSVWLTAAGRVGIPILLGVTMWAGSTVVALERRMAQAEQTDREVTRRVEQLESRRETDRTDNDLRERRVQELAARIQADVAAMRADQSAMLRSLQRVEQFIDRSATVSR